MKKELSIDTSTYRISFPANEKANDSGPMLLSLSTHVSERDKISERTVTEAFANPGEFAEDAMATAVGMITEMWDHDEIATVEVEVKVRVVYK